MEKNSISSFAYIGSAQQERNGYIIGLIKKITHCQISGGNAFLYTQIE